MGRGQEHTCREEADLKPCVGYPHWKAVKHGLAWREVDFIVVRDRKPWVLVEVKKADERMGPSLEHFQKQTKAPHAFQVVVDAGYVDADCFAKPGPPLVVPARTFLSQLL